ncbi:hypothetical protein JOY44_07100 [Phormidium sp. CLA17]|uniref:hypothetical protein n=1 Tax=Leptolyngbya sp. Cla-17 TaxID=2803751 RepID=UPI0019329A94|nr:hypothetical protein [Leptolyngbya sp. Cla-17]MBM0741387.1 hypothetical protein [Leptolyngbya sp. Cla-17]
MNTITKLTLNALMIVVVISPLVSVAFSSSPEAASARGSGKPGRLETGGSRAVPQSFIQELKS